MNKLRSWVQDENINLTVLLTLVALIFVVWAVVSYKGYTAEAEAGRLAAIPSDVVCSVFDMTGWKTVPLEKRMHVAKLVGAGKAEMLVALSIDCIERHPGNPNVGNIVHVDRTEWWRPIPKRKRIHDHP